MPTSKQGNSHQYIHRGNSRNNISYFKQYSKDDILEDTWFNLHLNEDIYNMHNI